MPAGRHPGLKPGAELDRRKDRSGRDRVLPGEVRALRHPGTFQVVPVPLPDARQSGGCRHQDEPILLYRLSTVAGQLTSNVEPPRRTRRALARFAVVPVEQDGRPVQDFPAQ